MLTRSLNPCQLTIAHRLSTGMGQHIARVLQNVAQAYIARQRAVVHVTMCCMILRAITAKTKAPANSNGAARAFSPSLGTSLVCMKRST